MCESRCISRYLVESKYYLKITIVLVIIQYVTLKLLGLLGFLYVSVTHYYNETTIIYCTS